VKAAILDISLHLLLIATTAVVVLRLEKTRWTHLQFSISDMLSLTAATSMVLGLIYLDRVPLAPEMYLRLETLPIFDRVMTLLAIACAVWLIVSTGSDRLGDKYAKQ
jgi:hypothetical protein